MPPKYYPPRIPPTPIEPDCDPNKTPTKSMYTVKKKSARSSSISRARSPVPRVKSPVPRIGSPLPRVRSPVSRPQPGSITLRAFKTHERPSVRNFFTQVEPTAVAIQPNTEPIEQELQYPPLFIRGTTTESEGNPQAQMDASVSTLRAVKTHERTSVRNFFTQVEPTAAVIQPKTEPIEQELQYPPHFIHGTTTESDAKPQAQMDPSVSYWHDRVRRAVDQKNLETDMFIAQIRVEKLEQERERAQNELERLREKRDLMNRGGQV